MNTTPFISIVICAYNAERFILESLGSACAQTYADIEIIVVDDCSDDGTVSIVREFMADDSRIKLVSHEENRGTARARKSGAFVATGRYVAYLDADDAYRADLCEIAVRNIEKAKPDIFHFPAEVIDVGDHSVETLRAVKDFIAPYSGMINDGLLQACFLERKYAWTLWNKLYKRDVLINALKHLGDDRIRIAEDVIVLFLVLYYSRSYYGITGKGLYLYRFGSGDTGSVIDIPKFEMYCRQILIVEAIHRFLREVEEFDNYKIVFDRIYHDLIHSCVDAFVSIDKSEQSIAHKLFVDYWGEENVTAALGNKYRKRQGFIRSALRLFQ